MAIYKLILPKMGESVSEATVTNWVKRIGDKVEEDDSVLEVATDKVDSDVSSPVSGVLKEIFFEINQVAQVGDVLGTIETNSDSIEIEELEDEETSSEKSSKEKYNNDTQSVPGLELLNHEKPSANQNIDDKSAVNRFYSPLVKNIAQQEGISLSELDSVEGSGAEGRLTKEDVLAYLQNRSKQSDKHSKSEKLTEDHTYRLAKQNECSSEGVSASYPKERVNQTKSIKIGPDDEIIEMDRMRRLISDHMVQSVHTSPHVFSAIEADLTNLVLWRNKIKDSFKKREGQNITFTPLIIEAISKAIRDFPMINVSIDGYNIVKRKHINVGMATALPSGNLIVPVIKDADQLSLVGLTKVVNQLALQARNNKLKPDDNQGGTFTFTNIGAFQNDFGLPIINQPQAAILAAGAIKKKPVVLETDQGDVIAIRHMMYITMSYDHRVIDGSLGGTFIKRVAEYLENWDVNRVV